MANPQEVSAEVSADATNGRKKRESVVENFYVAKDGSEASRPQSDVVAVKKVFKGSGKILVLKLAELEESVLLQAAAFGIQQAGQNAYGTATTDDERFEMCDDRWSTFRDDKKWASDRQVGPRTSDIVEAFIQAKEEFTGKKATDEDRADIRAKLEKEEVSAAELRKNPLIKAKLDAIKAERALAAAKASGAAVAEAGNDATAIFG